MTYITLGELCQNQKAYIQKVFKCISRYIHLYSGAQGVQCVYEEKICDSVVLGILVQMLKEHQLPLNSDTPIYHSLVQIRAILAEVRPHKYIFLDECIPGCCSQPLPHVCRKNCVKCSGRLCERCGKTYQKSSHVNHAACFPLERLKNEVLKIIQKVEGLDLTRFARKTRPAAVWDSLNYM